MNVEVAFEVENFFGRKIGLSNERLTHILGRIEMRNQQEKIRETLSRPDEVRKSVRDKSVWLFYKYFVNTPVSEKYLVVVVKVLN